MVIFTLSSIAWLGSPHSVLLKENHLTLFCLTMSLVFGRMTTKPRRTVRRGFYFQHRRFEL